LWARGAAAGNLLADDHGLLIRLKPGIYAELNRAVSAQAGSRIHVLTRNPE
jgi:hypothetical protein